MENHINELKRIYELKRDKKGSDIAGHLPLLYELASTLKPRVIIHAGIRDGNSGSAFALATLENDLTLIDIDPTELRDKELVTVRNQVPNWIFLQGRTDKPEIVEELRKRKGKVDIFFTDTSHNYEDTRFELFTYKEFLSDTAIILIHDMDPWGRYEDQCRAVQEFLDDNPEFKYTCQTGNNGMGVLYRDEAHLGGVVCDNDLGIGTHT